MKISNREIIIAAVAILVLLGIGYYINNNSSDKKEETKEEDQVNLDENSSDKSKDENNDSEEKKAEGVTSTEPEANANLTVVEAPKAVVLKSDKEMAAGSEIMVVSDKNVDVVTAGNKLTTDLKQLSAPVSITVPGTYSVTYNINWKDGTKSDGNYKFTVK